MLSAFPGFVGFFFGDVEPDSADLDGGAPMLAAADEALASLEPFEATAIETALRAAADRLGLKPRQPSPRCRGRRGVGAAGGSGFGGASGSRARWNASQARRLKRWVGRGRPAGSALRTPRPPWSGCGESLATSKR